MLSPMSRMMGSLLLVGCLFGASPGVVAAGAQGVGASTPAGELPGNSVFRLPVSLATSVGNTLDLASLRGSPLIVTMFYSRCTSVCPMVTSQLKTLVDGLPDGERNSLNVLMVSFDGGRDTIEALAAFKSEHGLTGDRWIVAKMSSTDVRMLAAALNIQYRELSDHTFNHSTVLTLTDAEGIIRASTRDPGDADGSFAAAVRKQMSGQQMNGR